VLRSIPECWDYLPKVGKRKDAHHSPARPEIAVFGPSRNLARLLFRRGHEAVQRRMQGQGSKTMSKMSKVGQHVLATVAAMLLTITAAGAAVAPAEAIQAAPVSLV
jgi:hypothetical protein